MPEFFEFAGYVFVVFGGGAGRGHGIRLLWVLPESGLG
jgi:hypothetical protein